MPNRIIKESILTSDSLSKLSWFEQGLFFRLLVMCDDYGRTDARPAIIRGTAYALYDVTNDQIAKALSSLATVGIVDLYEVGGKPYLQLKTWAKHQSIRAKKSKFPAPDVVFNADESICKQMHANVSVIQSNPIQSESKEDDEDARTRASIALVCECYEANMGTMPRSVGKDVSWYIGEGYAPELLCAAISDAAKHNARSWAYVERILQGCSQRGIKTLSAYQGEQAARKSKKASSANPFLDMVAAMEVQEK